MIQRRAGFTLIELSIVLVIIGLIVGGVLVGRDLIHAAEIRATVAQKEKYDAAVNTFRNKYNCLPGDCTNATNFGLTGGNGNGDGMIGWCNLNPGCNPTTGASVENLYFWYHLSDAGLIPDNIIRFPNPGFGKPGLATPAVKIASKYTVFSPGGWGITADAPFDATIGGGSFPANSFALISESYIPGNINQGAYAPSDIFAIDTKLDDGLPESGSARAYDNATILFDAIVFGIGSGVGAGGAANAVCIRNDTAQPEYNVQYEGSDITGLCGLVIKASF